MSGEHAYTLAPDQVGALRNIIRRHADFGDGKPRAPMRVTEHPYGAHMAGWLVEIDPGGLETGTCSSYLIDAVGTILVPDDERGEWIPERVRR